MKSPIPISAAKEALFALAIGLQNSAQALNEFPATGGAGNFEPEDDWAEWALEFAENELPEEFTPAQLITIVQGWDDPAAPLLVGEAQNRIQIAIARLSHLASHLHAHPCNPHQPLALALELTSEVPPVGISNLVATLRTLGDA